MAIHPLPGPSESTETLSFVKYNCVTVPCTGGCSEHSNLFSWKYNFQDVIFINTELEYVGGAYIKDDLEH